MALASPEPDLETVLARLRDGTPVCIRPALDTDRDRVREFLGHVSRSSLDLRFMAAVRPELAVSEILAPAGRTGRLSLLMETIEDDPPSVIGHGEYVRYRLDPSRAEVAFLIADDRHGQGAATLLLSYLARVARSAGILRFDAITFPENRPMIDVFVGAGFPCSMTTRGGVSHVTIDVSRAPQERGPGRAPLVSRPQIRA